jgi:hypothetical protein
MRPLALLSILVLACFAARLNADSLTLAGGLAYDPVRIDRIDNGKIYFFVNDEPRDRPVTDLVTFNLDDEPDYSAAETAYQKKDWAAATDGFSKALASTDKDWLKDFIAPRLLAAANQAHRFDAAITGWVQLNDHDPDAAASLRPSVPAAPDPQLAVGARELEDAAKLATGPARRSILALLLDVQTARQDSAAATAAAKALEDDQPVAPPTGPAAAGPAELAEQDALLVTAHAEFSDGKFDQAASVIDAAKARFTDPVHQAQALFLKAQILENKATGSDNADVWKDVALTYLRVYVHFPDGPASLHSAQSLMKAAQIEQSRLQEPAAAMILYQKLMNEYKDTVEARQAASLSAGLAARQGNDSAAH